MLALMRTLYSQIFAVSFFICIICVRKFENRHQWVLENCISKLEISLVHLISNGTGKTKLSIFAFLCCVEFVKTPNGLITHIGNRWLVHNDCLLRSGWSIDCLIDGDGWHSDAWVACGSLSHALRVACGWLPHALRIHGGRLSHARGRGGRLPLFLRIMVFRVFWRLRHHPDC